MKQAILTISPVTAIQSGCLSLNKMKKAAEEPPQQVPKETHPKVFSHVFIAYAENVYNYSIDDLERKRHIIDKSGKEIAIHEIENDKRLESVVPSKSMPKEIRISF